jgi:nitroreductase
MSEGLPPYVDVYVATNEGVFLYDWGNNSLGEISKEDIRAKIGAQRFVASAPSSLILVGNSKALSEFKDESVQKEFAHVAAGAMTQDTYLAAAALNVGTRYIHSMKTDEIRSALNLPKDDFPICLMIMGK